MSRERRQFALDEDERTAEPGRFGCPMLVRAHCGPLRGRVDPVFRCSLGWSLHSEADACRCRFTETVPECWKVHPERLPAVAELEVCEAVADAPVATLGD
jgi:hypothetical protein